MIHRLLPVLAVLTLVTGFVGSAHAGRLTKGDLRRFGFAGVYRGDVQGFVKTKDDDKFVNTLVSQTASETLPARDRAIVTGPTRRNGFFLIVRDITGNDRRITVRMYYSGKSYNPIYDEEMVGSGTKTLSVVKINSSRPQFEMSLSDKLSERAVNGGAFYSSWNITGRLFK
jgi:hypothetical protein